MSAVLHVLSDLHLDLQSPVQIETILKFKPQAPYLALLGDVCSITHPRFEEFLKILCDRFALVFFVPGNHEYYSRFKNNTKRDMDLKLTGIEERFSSSGFVVLNRSTYDICFNANVRIRLVGCTLWSHVDVEDTPFQRMTIENGISDYTYIGKETPENSWVHVNVEDTNSWYRQDVLWLQETLQKAEEDLQDNTKPLKEKEKIDGVIVLTHHAPLTHGTSDPKYENRVGKTNVFNQAFCTNLSGILSKHSNLIKTWAFGHTHWPCDFEEYGVRICSNPVGYRNEIDIASANKRAPDRACIFAI